MVRVAVHGAAGRMGRSIIGLLREGGDLQLAAAMDRAGLPCVGRDAAELISGAAFGVPVVDNFEALLRSVDVVIDFSLPDATAKLLPLCAAQRIPLVIGTTGLEQATHAAVLRAGEHIPIVHAPNYSQGVTVLFHLAALATKMLGPAFDAEITEIHHRHKVDAPSGTATRLLEVVAHAKEFNANEAAKHGRSGQVGARTPTEIGVAALRGGDVVGEHTLHLLGEGERIEISHSATDRSIFARGALRAAQWVVGKPVSVYSMADVMGISAASR